MAGSAAVAGAAFFLEYENLVAANVLHDRGADFCGLATSSEENRVTFECDGRTFLGVQFLNLEQAVFGHFILFSACANNCKHNGIPKLFRIYGQRHYTHGFGGVKKMVAKSTLYCNLNAVSTDSAPYQPFVLNRNPLRYVLIYGDDSDLTYSKVIWSSLGSADVKIINTNVIQDVIATFSDVSLAFVVLGEDGENAEMGRRLAEIPNMVGEIFGLTREMSFQNRIDLMAMGFDGIFNKSMTEQPSFQAILLKKIEKAKIRQTHLIMQEEYRRFRAALSASPDAFIVLDNDRRIFFVSEHYKRTYPRISQHLIRGLPIIEAFEMGRVEQGMSDDNPQYPMMKEFWMKLQGSVEFTMPDGRTWRIKAAPLADKQGTIITTTDITDILAQRQVIEEKSRQLEESLQKEIEASSLQKQFIGMVSHEFRTPLAIIDGHTQMIMRPGQTLNMDQIRARCKTISSAVSRLVHMMESVLSSNMLKTGRMDPEITSFNLGELIIELCNEQAELFRPDVISWDVSGLQDPVSLDKKMMTLIITNLLSNAVKFSRDDPKIRVSATSHGDDITITIADNGIGIPGNELEKIFGRYYRASTSSGIPGTGIGLHLSQSLMELMQGRIEVESKVGSGTTFILHLRNIK